MNMLQLFKDGGFVMIPLVVCSIFVWAIVVEKTWFLYSLKKEFHKILPQAEELLKAGQKSECKGLFMSTHPLLSKPLLTLFFAENENKEGRLHRRLGETLIGLKRFMWLLGTIGNSAPFIGLFGTVIGIIRSFESMAQSGKGGFAVVAAGLSEALIATAAGILVAVLAVLFYNYLSTKIQVFQLHFKNGVEDLMEISQSK
jgi:biopolymer transport protein ExbB